MLAYSSELEPDGSLPAIGDLYLEGLWRAVSLSSQSGANALLLPPIEVPV